MLRSFLLATLVSTVASLRCYHNGDTGSSSSLSSSWSAAIGGSFGGSSSDSPTLRDNCSQCTKYTASYSTYGLAYSTTRSECITSTGSSSGTSSCKDSVTFTAYTDGSLMQRVCSCCSDNCNAGSFCTQSDPNLQRLVSMNNQMNNQRCGAVQLAASTFMVVLPFITLVK